MPRICMFCRSELGQSRAKEHVVPKWMIREFGLAKQIIQPTHFAANFGAVLSQRKHDIGSFIAGDVCGSCNNGWMSRLESENMALICTLASGKKRISGLIEDESMGLARWATKTAYCLHAASNYRKLVPEEHYRALSGGQIPAGVCVVGKQIEPIAGFAWSQQASWTIHQKVRSITKEEKRGLRKLSYKIAIRMHGLILMVFAQSAISPARYLYFRGVHTPIYPRRGPVAWASYEPQGHDELTREQFVDYDLLMFVATLGIVPL